MKVDDLDVVAAADRGLLEEWAVGLDALGELIGPRFFRREPRVRALAYVKALLSQVETRNGWTVAEAAGEKTPTGMQRLLNDAVWDEAGVREDLRSYVVTHLGADDGVLVFDETGDIKQGNHTVGGPPIHGRDRPGGELPGVGARRIRVQPRAGADRHRAVPAGCLRARLRALRRGGCAGRTRRGRDHQRGPGRGHVRSGGRRRDALQLCRRRRGLRPIDQPALRDRDSRWLRLRAGGGLRPPGLSRTRRQAK